MTPLTTMQSKLHKLMLLFLCLLIIENLAFADLELSLTRGYQAAIPVGVSAFDGEERIDRDDMPEGLTGVIQHDMSHSGQLRSIRYPDQTVHHDLHDWRARGAEYVVTGNIKKNTNQTYQMTYQLHALYHKKDKTIMKDRVLSSKQFTVTKNNLRDAAHRISDLIYG